MRSLNAIYGWEISAKEKSNAVSLCYIKEDREEDRADRKQDRRQSRQQTGQETGDGSLSPVPCLPQKRVTRVILSSSDLLKNRNKQKDISKIYRKTETKNILKNEKQKEILKNSRTKRNAEKQ